MGEGSLDKRTFFLDTGLGRTLEAAVRALGHEVEMHDSHFPPGTPDRAWIARCGTEGWIGLSMDRSRSDRDKESIRLAVAESGGVVFQFTAGHQTGADQAQRFQKASTRIVELAKKKPPFVATNYKSGKADVTWRPSKEWWNNVPPSSRPKNARLPFISRDLKDEEPASRPNK